MELQDNLQKSLIDKFFMHSYKIEYDAMILLVYPITFSTLTKFCADGGYFKEIENRNVITLLM